MQVATPSLSTAPHTPGPSRQELGVEHIGSPEAKASRLSPSPRRLRRSLRLSGAPFSSPQNDLNKENLGTGPLNQPSTSAKTLDVGSPETNKLSSNELATPLISGSARHSSPLQSQSSPNRPDSPLHRTLNPQSDDFVSSSDESDDSALVFFGKPSSAEKKKRIHYEQRVLEKRLKHKDSLDLARRRPISFNPDDTMLVDDQQAFGWSWSKSTPTPSRPVMMLLSSPALSSSTPASPIKSRESTRSSSPDPLSLSLHLHTQEACEQQASPSSNMTSVAEPFVPLEGTFEEQRPSASSTDLQQVDQEELSFEPQSESEHLDPESSEKPNINPFNAAQRSPDKGSAPKSPKKQRSNSPSRTQSPVRSVETLIGVTLAYNRDLASPVRSPRRSPRLSLRSLQLSTSPNKPSGCGLFFGPTTPFQRSLATQQATLSQHATPFQQPATALPVPPSTGLSRFACLQNLSPTTKVPETPASRVLSMRLVQHTVLPSPFLSSGVLGPLAETSIVRTTAHESPSLSPGAGKQTPSPRKQSTSVHEPAAHTDTDLRSDSPSKPVSTPGTPSVRFTEPDMYTTPKRTSQYDDVRLQAAHSQSCGEAQNDPDAPRPPKQEDLESDRELSALRDGAVGLTELPSTPPSAPPSAKAETPGPVFRQTARRVPIHQHEADFGVKVSPEKPSYSPRKIYANSSSRTNEFGSKPDRIPARRVPAQSAVPPRQISTKQGESPTSNAARVASIASKAARKVSAGARIGVQSKSLSAAVLSRAVSSTGAPSTCAPAPVAASTQSTLRIVSSGQGLSVAAKTSRFQRSASAAVGNKLSSPAKQARSFSGLPRPKSASAVAASTLVKGPGSRLPRPATLGQSTNVARSTSRPVPMAIARLAPAQQGLHQAASVPSKAQVATQTSASSTDSAPASELSDSMQDEEMEEAVHATPQTNATNSEAEVGANLQLGLQAKQAEGASSGSIPSRRQISASALRVLATEADAKAQPDTSGQTLQIKTVKPIAREADALPTRSSSPVVLAPPTGPPSSARSAPPVILDPEQQRLRCLAMQEKARNRTPKASSSASAPTSSDAEELLSSEGGLSGGSPQAEATEIAPSSVPGATPAGDASLIKHAEASDPTSMTPVSSNVVTTGKAGLASGTASTATSTGRPLRSTRLASRPLTPSATRVPPSRGRALSLNDIIAARKIDVPLSLTDQLRLADTVNKKHNEKTLVRYKITKIQRPYERPPSPERHDHEPEACTIIDDFGSHRQGKGDVAPYTTPVKGSSSPINGTSDGRKCVRWYRPLFVGEGSQYGIRACEAKPALKPIRYELDRMGNKVATGNSPKLNKGQSIVIYRNYFKGEPEPADD